MSRGLLLAAAASLTLMSNLTAASAMPISIGASLQPADTAIAKVQYYPETPLDLPAAIIGGTLGAVAGALSATTAGPFDQGVGYGPSWNDRMAACAATYISFDPSSGMYMTYEGFPVLCPFLR